MRKILFLLWVLVCVGTAFAQDATQGSLFANNGKGRELGACPLKTTSVNADISGFLARVTVRQEFENKFASPIEAVYVFPLSQNGAVDRMTMTVGTRSIHGKIMKREEARQTYETAKSEGKVASLLDQERPNIFTQSVANIMPGESVIVEISYVETLKYEDGAYEFVFPMTVGPRYIPGGVKDAARISPPKATTRDGHDISIDVNVNAGVPIEGIRSTSHAIDQVNLTSNNSKVTLRSGKVIPNKDFVLRYDVTGKRIEDAILTHRDERGGFFTMILQPPDKIATEDRTPKEIVFVLDTSGSMSGFPIEKAKEAMKLSIDGLYPEDTFNVITFAGDTEILFEQPVPATQANLERAQSFLAGRSGGGGTEMMKAIKAALDPSDAQDHLRIVCFMTDGEVGNDDEIIAEVQRHPKARVFSFGIGSSVNRSLLDKIALEGKGEATYVALEDDGSKAARKFYERVRTPLLTDLSIDWNGMPVEDIYPNRLTDLFSAKPVILHGRYAKAASGTIKLRGNIAGQPYEREIKLDLPEKEAANDVLATLWARTTIDDLSSAALKAEGADGQEKLNKQITELGLGYGLMTQFTSFVAVEDRLVNQGGTPVRMEVPVEAPAGTTGEVQDDPNGRFEAEYGGATGRVMKREPKSRRSSAKNLGYIASGGGGGGAGGGGRGVGRGSGRGTGAGSGSGSGYGGGMGTGSGGIGTGDGDAGAPPPKAVSYGVINSSPSVSATVNVTSNAVSIDTSDTKISTSISTQTIQALPKGTHFSSLLRLSPSARTKPLSGGFQIDGSSGAENTFVIDGQELRKMRGGTTINAANVPSELDGKTVLVVRPDRPARLAAAASVVVDIDVDTLGNVVAAHATSGPVNLRSSSEKAAMLTRFAPTFADGHAVRLKGAIDYRFTRAKQVGVGLREIKAMPPTADDERLARIDAKLHFWVAALVRRIGAPANAPGVNEAMFVHNGKADLQIELTERSNAVIAKLTAAGLEVVSMKGKMTIMGRADPARIAGLADIAEVKLILPRF